MVERSLWTWTVGDKLLLIATAGEEDAVTTVVTGVWGSSPCLTAAPRCCSTLDRWIHDGDGTGVTGDMVGTMAGGSEIQAMTVASVRTSDELRCLAHKGCLTSVLLLLKRWSQCMWCGRRPEVARHIGRGRCWGQRQMLGTKVRPKVAREVGAEEWREAARWCGEAKGAALVPDMLRPAFVLLARGARA